jgi:hypothetical protein
MDLDYLFEWFQGPFTNFSEERRRGEKGDGSSMRFDEFKASHESGP